ncbi:PREDICTED: aspartic proteinase Asp1-like [Tarenaya hassleriana]|uniref:aspartic proteinase Asp1-like n=1 Tax=Tarenaya hassleriana TaxID=28532 RepID=UPI00053C7906|nr:PREDICTED: aspartic proteinase Asp1-like [Tarenaya hassleriana]
MKVGIAVVLMVSLVLGFSSAADFRWRKTASFGGFFGRAPSSIVFPVHGNVYPVGYYNVTINVGQPSRPYYLDLDTGSDLTWLQCDAPCVRCVEAPHPLYEPSNDLIPCKDPLCKALHSHGDQRCEAPEQCDYEVEYADGGSSLGVLVRDVFSLNYTNGARLNPRLALGCGYDQIPGGSSHPLDGVLGLGRGKVSILSQLHGQGYVRNVIGHCLSSLGGGFLFFGSDLFDSSRVSWTPMSREHSKHYSPGPGGELLFGGKTTGLKNLLVVFDSGSSYTYFNSKAYQAVTYLLRRELSGKPLTEARDDHTLPLCWQGRRRFSSIGEVKKYFKPLSFSFKTGWRSKSLFEIPPEAYLIISMKGNVCLGILNGTEIGLQNLNLIGDVSMQDQMVIYDNEKQSIGWMPANCNDIASLKSSEAYGY